MDNTSQSQEEIEKRREFAYRAFSPDSEPPSPLHDNKNQKNKTEPTSEATDSRGQSASPESGRQSA